MYLTDVSAYLYALEGMKTESEKFSLGMTLCVTLVVADQNVR